MFTFKGRTADGVWRAAAAAMPSAANQDGRGGSTKELLHVALEIEDPTQRWVISREPAMNPAFAIAEAIWILSGRRDASFIKYWNPQYPKYAGEGPEYHGAYGHRIRTAFGIDQLERAYQALQKNPDSRQVVLQIWSATLDFPHEDGTPANQDIPCNVGSLLKVRDGALHWTQIMRSNDLHRGLPHNIVQFTVLQEVLAGWLGLRIGPYHHWSDSLHVYEGDLGEFSIGPPGVATSTAIHQSRREWEREFPIVCATADRLTSPELTEKELLGFLTIPGSWSPYVAVLCSDAARRHGWQTAAFRSLELCADLGLRALAGRWLEAKGHPK